MARLANQMKQLWPRCAQPGARDGQADLDGADDVGFDIELPIFTVGQTAELANIHPQTLVNDRLVWTSAAHGWRRSPLAACAW